MKNIFTLLFSLALFSASAAGPPYLVILNGHATNANLHGTTTVFGAIDQIGTIFGVNGNGDVSGASFAIPDGMTVFSGDGSAFSAQGLISWDAIGHFSAASISTPSMTVSVLTVTNAVFPNHISGTNLTTGTVNSNKLDAATLALLGSGGSPFPLSVNADFGGQWATNIAAIGGGGVRQIWIDKTLGIGIGAANEGFGAGSLEVVGPIVGQGDILGSGNTTCAGSGYLGIGNRIASRADGNGQLRIFDAHVSSASGTGADVYIQSLTVQSNSWTPTSLAAQAAFNPGDNRYLSSNGVPHVVWMDGASVMHTNRLVP